MPPELIAPGTYENDECPDCGESIPKDAIEGGECRNCGHVFHNYRPIDDGIVPLYNQDKKGN